MIRIFIFCDILRPVTYKWIN